MPEDLQDSNPKARPTELFDLFSFSSKDLEFVVKFAQEHGSDIFRQILQSICPSIYGHELVKAGITLSLFGGVRKHAMDQNKVPVRGDIHVIIVGDPGLGKSQLLQAAAAVSPRGIYVCGNATTKAGLTVAVVKDPMTSDYAFEAVIDWPSSMGCSFHGRLNDDNVLFFGACSVSLSYAELGAMVLADSGLCCIDEFDKMPSEHQALLEAMEQQSVSIAKAGLVASLSSRTSVLAAANPAGGHYNRAKTVNENLKMSAALLSRFDLIFILLDKPDELMDKRLSDHIMAESCISTPCRDSIMKTVIVAGDGCHGFNGHHDFDVTFLPSTSVPLPPLMTIYPLTLHGGNGQLSPALKKRRGDPSDPRATVSQNAEGVVDLGIRPGSLISRLRLDPLRDCHFVPLPGQLLRKYIAYARSFVFPRMTKPAAEILQKFYLKLRDHSTSADGTPITARQLESLVRLAEARARLDLRVEITAQDATDVVEIMKESLYDKYVDEHGIVDFGRSGGMSQQKEAKRFLNALNKQSEYEQKDCFSVSEIYSLADRISLKVPDIDTFIENLNSVGYLLKKGPKMYQVLSSSYARSQPFTTRG
ncbi:unnamed protein product [Sphenostylis stenocarpa]|uniref:DNA helicase n=1 Tax=Sphenostylis stenocarpa TaxID=92480 RepID=A0AA86RZE6_9FABA|nr:unnamed protein product [Sphenostylis stenocarpa]